ncbi:Aspartate 1-decarboxylase precursor [compost metagenome]
MITGPRGSGVICLNGAAARLVQPGDSVIIISYAMMSAEELRSHKPTVVFVDENNHVVTTETQELHATVR